MYAVMRYLRDDPLHDMPVHVGEALHRAREVAQARDLIVVTGSLFLVGEALEALGLGATNGCVFGG